MWSAPRSIPLAMLPALLLLAGTAHPQGTATETVEQFHRAVGLGDRAAAAVALAPNAQIFESGYVERSRDEYLSHHFEADAKFAKTVARKVVSQSEQLSGDMALVVAETTASGSYEGKSIRLIGLETAVLRLVDRRWQIVHIHWSSRTPKT